MSRNVTSYLFKPLPPILGFCMSFSWPGSVDPGCPHAGWHSWDEQGLHQPLWDFYCWLIIYLLCSWRLSSVRTLYNAAKLALLAKSFHHHLHIWKSQLYCRGCAVSSSGSGVRWELRFWLLSREDMELCSFKDIFIKPELFILSLQTWWISRLKQLIECGLSNKIPCWGLVDKISRRKKHK